MRDSCYPLRERVARRVRCLDLADLREEGFPVGDLYERPFDDCLAKDPQFDVCHNSETSDIDLKRPEEQWMSIWVDLSQRSVGQHHPEAKNLVGKRGAYQTASMSISCNSSRDRLIDPVWDFSQSVS